MRKTGRGYRNREKQNEEITMKKSQWRNHNGEIAMEKSSGEKAMEKWEWRISNGEKAMEIKQ